MPCRYYRIKGKVQGVFYRASAQQQAERAGLNGWVKNASNGDVESVACGTQQQLQHYSDWLKKGPPMAVVNSVEVKEYTDENIGNGFRIVY